MRTRYLAEKPNDIVFTLKIEGTAAEFFDLRDELQRYGPRALPAPLTRQLTEDISKVLAASQKVLYPKDGEVIGAFMGHAISADPSMPDDIKELLRKRCNAAD